MSIGGNFSGQGHLQHPGKAQELKDPDASVNGMVDSWYKKQLEPQMALQPGNNSLQGAPGWKHQQQLRMEAIYSEWGPPPPQIPRPCALRKLLSRIQNSLLDSSLRKQIIQENGCRYQQLRQPSPCPITTLTCECPSVLTELPTSFFILTHKQKCTAQFNQTFEENH